MFEMAHVGNVADITYLVPEVAEKFNEYIICHTRSCMAEVSVAIDSRTADIKSYMSLVDRLENLFLS
jgi:hypothetical protein